MRHGCRGPAFNSGSIWRNFGFTRSKAPARDMSIPLARPGNPDPGAQTRLTRQASPHGETAVSAGDTARAAWLAAMLRPTHPVS